MIEKILPDLYRVEIPLAETPLKAVNSYIVKDSDRTLIVDTGFNSDSCLEAMRESLLELEVDLGKASFFITHSHSDHLGLISRLAGEGSTVYFNRPDAKFLTDMSRWEAAVAYAGRSGLPMDAETVLYTHPGYRYRPDVIPPFTFVEDGDTIAAGRYTFRCIATPGHTKGHICLYDGEHKVLLSGDHILGDITPNITCWWDDENPLRAYLESLDKVAHLDVDVTLPGHRRIIRDLGKRIEELRRHHDQRTDEVLSILKKGPRNGFQTAGAMTWDLAVASWDDFPPAQQWFATGEALAHLRYLEDLGLVRRVPHDRFIVFAANR